MFILRSQVIHVAAAADGQVIRCGNHSLNPPAACELILLPAALFKSKSAQRSLQSSSVTHTGTRARLMEMQPCTASNPSRHVLHFRFSRIFFPCGFMPNCRSQALGLTNTTEPETLKLPPRHPALIFAVKFQSPKLHEFDVAGPVADAMLRVDSACGLAAKLRAAARSSAVFRRFSSASFLGLTQHSRVWCLPCLDVGVSIFIVLSSYYDDFAQLWTVPGCGLKQAPGEERPQRQRCALASRLTIAVRNTRCL